MDDLEHARAGARELVDLARNGDTPAVFEAFRRITREHAQGGHGAEPVIGELVFASAEMMLLRAQYTAEDATFAVDLKDDEQFSVPIDELTPPLRATVRALLAELNGHRDEAWFQVRLALREPDVNATLDVLVHALLWTIGMLEWCVAEDVAVPGWLRVTAP